MRLREKELVQHEASVPRSLVNPILFHSEQANGDLRKAKVPDWPGLSRDFCPEILVKSFLQMDNLLLESQLLFLQSSDFEGIGGRCCLKF